jgi:hypothetical protein
MGKSFLCHIPIPYSAGCLSSASSWLSPPQLFSQRAEALNWKRYKEAERTEYWILYWIPFLSPSFPASLPPSLPSFLLPTSFLSPYLALARQALYHLGHTSNPFSFSYFFRTDLEFLPRSA